MCEACYVRCILIAFIGKIHRGQLTQICVSVLSLKIGLKTGHALSNLSLFLSGVRMCAILHSDCDTWAVFYKIKLHMCYFTYGLWIAPHLKISAFTSPKKPVSWVARLIDILVYNDSVG